MLYSFMCVGYKELIDLEYKVKCLVYSFTLLSDI